MRGTPEEAFRPLPTAGQQLLRGVDQPLIAVVAALWAAKRAVISET
jgi:hypothetical protein